MRTDALLSRKEYAQQRNKIEIQCKFLKEMKNAMLPNKQVLIK